jgi:hypothetical protein
MRAKSFGAPSGLLSNELDTCLVAVAPPLCNAAPEYLPTNFGPELLQEIDGHGKADLLCPISQSVGSQPEPAGYPRGRDRGRSVSAGQIRKVQCSAPLVVVSYKTVGDRVQGAFLEPHRSARYVSDFLMQGRRDGSLQGSLHRAHRGARGHSESVAAKPAAPLAWGAGDLVQHEGREYGPKISANGPVILSPIKLPALLSAERMVAQCRSGGQAGYRIDAERLIRIQHRDVWRRASRTSRVGRIRIAGLQWWARLAAVTRLG